MANLGTLTTKIVGRIAHTRPVPAWNQTPGVNILSLDASGAISGAVDEETAPSTYTPKSGATVRLYYRPNGLLIATTTTDGSGNFSFSGLDTADLENYSAVAVDDDAGTDWNLAVADRITAS